MCLIDIEFLRDVSLRRPSLPPSLTQTNASAFALAVSSPVASTTLTVTARATVAMIPRHDTCKAEERRTGGGGAALMEEQSDKFVMKCHRPPNSSSSRFRLPRLRQDYVHCTCSALARPHARQTGRIEGTTAQSASRHLRPGRAMSRMAQL